MTLHRLRRQFEPLIRRGFHFYGRFARGATLGAFAMVIDGKGRAVAPPSPVLSPFLRSRLAS